MADKVIAHDLHHRVFSVDGVHYVEVEIEQVIDLSKQYSATRDENHMTNRASGREYARKALGDNWDIEAYVSTSHCRRSDGYPARWRKYLLTKGS